MASTCCPHWCFLSELSHEASEGKKRLFRLLGTVVSILAVSDDEYHPQVVLDDGTALVCVSTPTAMLQAIRVQVGKTVECIAVLDGSNQRLIADQLAWITDVHAETLRWAQLAYFRQEQERLPRDEENDQDVVGWGYPPLRTTADDVFDLIQSQSLSWDGKNEKDKGGFTLDEISLLLDLPVSVILPMVEELQLSAKIYQNQEGRYLSL